VCHVVQVQLSEQSPSLRKVKRDGRCDKDVMSFSPMNQPCHSLVRPECAESTSFPSKTAYRELVIVLEADLKIAHRLVWGPFPAKARASVACLGDQYSVEQHDFCGCAEMSCLHDLDSDACAGQELSLRLAVNRSRSATHMSEDSTQVFAVVLPEQTPKLKGLT
jgi:hypothetical protein